MLEAVNTSTCEFVNDGHQGNMTRYVDRHSNAENIHITLQSSTEKLPHAAPLKSAGRNHYFQPAKTKPSLLKSQSMTTQSSPEKEKNYSVAYLDKGLIKLPAQVLDRKSLITVLDLSRNKFEYFPLEIIQVTNLKVLKLDYNKIKCLPGDIYKLARLEVLSMGYNSLQTLPTNFAKLNNLRDLNLQNNLLEAIGEELTSLKDLKNLNILQNKLTLFTTLFHNLVSLNELHFEWFKYCNPIMSQHQKGDEGAENIKTLREFCELRKSEKGIGFQEFVEHFSTLPIALDAVDDHDRTILHIASACDDVSVIRFVISHLPQLIDRLDKDNNTAFCTAIIKDNQYAARYLLKHGANPTKGGGVYGSALHIAVKKLNHTIVNDILSLGENPNKIDNDGNTPLHLAVLSMAEGYAKAPGVAQLLLDQGANPNARNRENWTPMHLAARRRDAKTLKWIMSYNMELSEIHGREEVFKINKRGGAYKWTAMHIAAYSGSSEMVQIMGDAGIDLFKRSVNGYTAKRVVNKFCVAMKLIEKYENAWIQSKIIKRKTSETDSIMDTNLNSLNRVKEIQNASKNKFGEGSFIVQSDETTAGMNPLPLNFGYFFKTKVNLNLQLNGGMLSKQDFTDSDEVTPEMETEMEDDEEEDETCEDIPDTARLDFCTEINEDITVGVDPYNKRKEVKEKTLNPNGTKQIPANRHLKNKSTVNVHQILNIEPNSYEKQIKLEPNFEFNYCKREMKTFKENLLSDRLLFSDKLKVVSCIKLFNTQIFDYIFKHFIIPVPRESFPFYVLKESISKGKKHGTLQNGVSQNGLVIIYFELVPQLLIDVIQTLSGATFENIMLRVQCINLLSELLYFPAIEYFEKLIASPEEDFLVKNAARTSSAYLKSLLDPELIKHHLRHAGQKEIMKKNYGNMLHAKTTSSPLMMLENKDNNTHMGSMRDELI